MIQLFAGIDPDLHNTAIAWLNQDGSLYNVFTTNVHKDIKGEDAVICSMEQLFDLSLNFSAETVFAVEGQEIYQKSKARPNDQIKLAQVAGACVAFAYRDGGSARTYLPTPKKWKGSVPKEIHQARILKKLGVPYKVCSGYCSPIFETGHKFSKIRQGQWKHIVDAIGLAQYALKEWSRSNPQR